MFPTQPDSCLHGNPGPDTRRQDTVTVCSRLAVKEFPARQGNDSDPDSLGGQLFTGSQGDINLGARPDQDHLVFAFRGFPEDIAPPLEAPGRCKVRLIQDNAVGPLWLRSAARQASMVSQASAGRMTVKLGITRILIRCSMG